MGKTYVPSLVRKVREQAIFIARYQSTLLAAIAIIDPASVPLFAAYVSAVVALNAKYDELYPEGD